MVKIHPSDFGPVAVGEDVFAAKIRPDYHKSVIYLYGFGTYEGLRLDMEYGFWRPAIALNNGERAWDDEAWWGPMTKWPDIRGDKAVIFVPLNRERTIDRKVDPS